ncbi:hypothetical protein D6856_03520 [Butyrivibrio sp. XB500-5]|nr:hypothetical protein D6856_03520 [Butyrivibrio sp. XB500-5]
MASHSDYDNSIVSDEKWQDFFLRNYIQSMFDGYDYKKKILKEQDGLMTKTQIEYINYSLTGEYAIFDSLENDEINCLESQNSPLVAYTITDYEYEEQGENIVLKADADFFKKGSTEKRKYIITAVLERNPYSCFDGYSIVSIKTEDVTEYEHGDEATITATSVDLSDTLDIKEYQYPEEFAIGDNLRAMLENCAIYYTDYNNSNEIDAEWEQGFIHNFCQNSWFGYDYLNSIGDNGGLTISKEQVEYIYNSFSGNSAEFMSLTEGEDIKIDEASSGFSYAELLDYKTEDNGDEINLSVTFKISNAVDGDIEKEGKVTLIKNPYSCFDGYSVKSFHISKIHTDAETISSKNVFFDGTKTDETYKVTELLDEAVSEVEVKTEKIAEYDSGEVYSISIGYESPEISGTDKEERLNIGRFLVSKDNIYLLLEENGIPSEEEFVNNGIVVASDDDYSKIIGEVYQVEITHEGDKCIFAMWNTAIESGWYCHYEWIKGCGLVYYRSGYGAARDAIEITNSLFIK